MCCDRDLSQNLLDAMPDFPARLWAPIRHSCHQTQSDVSIKPESVWDTIVIIRINGLHAIGGHRFNWEKQSNVWIRRLSPPTAVPIRSQFCRYNQSSAAGLRPVTRMLGRGLGPVDNYKGSVGPEP